jgi:hypothetical protein
LGRVFEQQQVARLRQLLKRSHIACLTVEMDGNYRRGAISDGCTRRVWIDQPGPRLDIA